MGLGGEAAVVAWCHLGESLGATRHRDDDVLESAVRTIVDVDRHVGRAGETPQAEYAAEKYDWRGDNYCKDVE